MPKKPTTLAQEEETIHLHSIVRVINDSIKDHELND